MLPALLPDQKGVGHRTVLPQFPVVGLRQPRLEQLAKLFASMSTTATKHLPRLRTEGWPILCKNSELGWSATQIVLSELDAVRGEENNQVDVQHH